MDRPHLHLIGDTVSALVPRTRTAVGTNATSTVQSGVVEKAQAVLALPTNPLLAGGCEGMDRWKTEERSWPCQQIGVCATFGVLCGSGGTVRQVPAATCFGAGLNGPARQIAGCIGWAMRHPHPLSPLPPCRRPAVAQPSPAPGPCHPPRDVTHPPPLPSPPHPTQAHFRATVVSTTRAASVPSSFCRHILSCPSSILSSPSHSPLHTNRHNASPGHRRAAHRPHLRLCPQ